MPAPAHLGGSRAATAGPTGRTTGPAVLAVALGLLGLAAAGTRAPASAEEVREIDWRTSPLDLNLRGLNGERFRFRCPPGKPAPDLVVGSHPYADSSSICTAAVHAGLVHASVGGVVTIEIQPGRKGYRGTTSHYVTSTSYDGPWGGSFTVLAGDAPLRLHQPSTPGAHG